MSDTPLQVAREHAANPVFVMAAWPKAEESREPLAVFALSMTTVNAQFTTATAVTNIELTVEPDLG